MHHRGGMFLFLVSLTLSLVLVTGCDTTKISDINRDPTHYAGKEVTVAGQVVNSFGFMNQGAFEIDDGTGRLWVLSNGYGVPSQGARVGVRGRIQPGVTIGTRSFANILRESERRRVG